MRVTPSPVECGRRPVFLPEEDPQAEAMLMLKELEEMHRVEPVEPLHWIATNRGVMPTIKEES